MPDKRSLSQHQILQGIIELNDCAFVYDDFIFVVKFFFVENHEISLAVDFPYLLAWLEEVAGVAGAWKFWILWSLWT